VELSASQRRRQYNEHYHFGTTGVRRRLAVVGRALAVSIHASPGRDDYQANYVNHCVPQLISLLSQHRETTGSKGERLMETLAELLCFILNPERAWPMFTFAAAHACRPLVMAETNRDLLLQ
jgi:hypothetical protein